MCGAPSIVSEVRRGTMVTPSPSFQYLAGASCSPHALQARQIQGSPRGATLVPSRPSAVKLKLRLEIETGWPRAGKKVSLREPLIWASKQAEFGHAGVDDDVIGFEV